MPPKPPKPVPRFLPSMLLKLVPTLPEGEHWLYEVKWDGYRAIAVWRMASLPFGPVMKRDLGKRFPALQ